MANRIDRHVGARLRAARRARGLTQPALASRLGISYQQLQKYETGGSRLGASRLWDCAAALGVDPDWFFAGLDAGPDAGLDADTAGGPAEGAAGGAGGAAVDLALAAEVNALPGDVQAALLQLARRINRRR